MATQIVICGAAGRMGRALIEIVAETDGAKLAGAVEAPGNPTLGQDAGLLAGIRPQGVTVTDDLAAVTTPDTVVVDFTMAEATVRNLKTVVDRGGAMVIGTTGFSDEQKAEIAQLAPRIRCVIAPNMSVGVAVLQRLVKEATLALGNDFDIEIVETHHRMKVDAPSGTALALAQAAADASGRDLADDARYGRQGIVGRRTNKEIGILALRGGDVVGDHTVVFAGAGERIELTHRAQSRDCLARGAIRAALWVVSQPAGRYGIADVLGL